MTAYLHDIAVGAKGSGVSILAPKPGDFVEDGNNAMVAKDVTLWILALCCVQHPRMLRPTPKELRCRVERRDVMRRSEGGRAVSEVSIPASGLKSI